MEKWDNIIQGKYEETMGVSVRREWVGVEIHDGKEYAEIIIDKDVFYKLIDKLQKLRDDQDGKK